VRIEQELQVGESVLDLLAFVESDAANDPVGQILAAHRILNHARLGVGAVEHGHHVVHVLAPRAARGLRDKVGFLEFVPAAGADDEIPALDVGPEGLLFAIAVIRDDGRRRIEYHLRGAVVAFETNDLGLREVLLEVENVADIGAAPRVDRLIGVANHRQVAVDFGESAHQEVLGPVGILVLVDHHEAEPLRIVPPDHLGLFEQLHRAHQQVVKIERAAGFEHPGVLEIDAGNLVLPVA
jgi:hypothetical protein